MRKALRHGAKRVSASTVHWHCEADCENPWYRSIEATPSARPHPETGDDNTGTIDKMYEWTPGRRHFLRVELWTRCNRCQKCLAARARLWAARIRYETENAPRTWFGTLTLNPASHLRCEVLAQRSGSTPLAVSGKEVTRYLKRLRKHATGKLRFVCVTERHKSGKHHYHLLIHEQTRGCLTHRVLAEQWTWGFEKFRVVDPQIQPAWYLCKYLTKEYVDRVRASVRYGGRQLD